MVPVWCDAAMTFVMSAVLICKWTLSHYDDDDDDDSKLVPLKLRPGVKAGCAHLCRVAGNTVCSHMASDTL